MTDSARIAVLIDADNTSAVHASDLLAEVARFGVPTIKRAYGDWTTTQLTGWKQALNGHAITPMQQFAYTRGKNATDSALIIDAMDLLYSDNVDAFAIVSSDSDFTRLATRLRESGKTVYGFGRKKTPAAFVAACDRFIYLEVLTAQDRGPAEPVVSEPVVAGSDDPDREAAAPLPELRALLTRSIDTIADDDGWATLSQLGQYLSNTMASFDPRLYGAGKLSTLVRGEDYLEVGEPAGGSGLHVRLRPAKPARKRAAARKSTTAAS